MNTPLIDFLKQYSMSGTVRMHMPGHKGHGPLGCESFDITEISGADNLYDAHGILDESQKNAAALFGSAASFYSTEGSTLAIKAMLHLAVTQRPHGAQPLILAARNIHKAFIYAAALIDFEVRFITSPDDSLFSCVLRPKDLEQALNLLSAPPAAVYVTSPDYLGRLQPIHELAEICHAHGTRLLVDNAHGAYLRFCTPSMHPLDLGADACCDSAHKTLPVLTGGAYLHISHHAPTSWVENAVDVLSIYASTSPSYLIMASLDACNAVLADNYKAHVAHASALASGLRDALRCKGYPCLDSEPLKVTIDARAAGLCGTDIAGQLRSCGIECEHADADAVVLMLSTENAGTDYQKVLSALTQNTPAPLAHSDTAPRPGTMLFSIRKALFLPSETIEASQSVGRVCASPTVTCPPAIPIVIPGEIITDQSVALFSRYGIDTIRVVKSDEGLN